MFEIVLIPQIVNAKEHAKLFDCVKYNNTENNTYLFNENTDLQVIIPSDAIYFNGHYYKIFTETMNWSEAKKYCEEIDGHLVTITSADEQAFIETINMNNYNLWIGAYRDELFNWYWVTGEEWDYTNWADGEPNDSNNVVANENCVALWSKLWNDLNQNNLSEQRGYICEWDNAPLGDSRLYNGHTYQIFSINIATWEDVNLYCKELGGHLATITTPEENNFLFEMMLDCGYQNAYFGLSDSENEGDWKWVTDELFSYSNWHSGEPNSENSSENYAMFFYKFSDGTWNDGDFNNNMNGNITFICEWDEPHYNQQKYKLFDLSMTWNEAKEYCEHINGHLVTITSQEEQNYLQFLIGNGNKGQYWIGGYKQDDEWAWITDEKWNYSNWANGEPNNEENDECCIEIINKPFSTLTFGEWNDLNPSGDPGTTCDIDNIGFICEWDNGIFSPPVLVTPEPDEPLPPVTRTITAEYSGGTGIICDADYNAYSTDSFMFFATLTNMFQDGDLNRNDCSAYNVKAEITLPDGFSFDKTSKVSSKTYTFDEISIMDNIIETVYLQKPPIGKSTAKIHITADNAKEVNSSYEFNIDKYEFNADVYRADFLTKSDLGSKMENTYFNLPESPSQKLVKAAKENGLDFATNTWAAFMNTMDIADNPSKILDYAIEEADMYEAIIMSMFESSVDYKVMGYINDDTTKKSKKLMDLITSEMKDVYQMTNFDWDKMSAKERQLLADNISNFFKRDNSAIATTAKISSVTGNVLKYAGDAQSAIETIVSYYNMWCLSDAMKQILDDMYIESLSYNNSALSQAILNCTSIINSGAAEFAASMTGYATLAVGKDLAQFAFDKFWGKVKTAFQVSYPGAFLLHATYTASKYITGVCFNADAIEEKYCKMEALVNMENVLMSVYNTEKNNFKAANSPYTAEVYNSAVDVMFNMLDIDCDYAIAFADAIDSSLFGKISAALGDKTIEDFKKSVRSIQSSTFDFHETVLIYWIGELEKDGNDRYKEYLPLFDESWERVKKRYNINCPVDVYVFDTDGVLVGSVVDNVPYCRSDANITIATEGDKKTIYMYGDSQYKIVYEGNDTGTMDIAVTEYDDNNSSRNVYFNGLELKDGLKYTSTENGTVSEDNAYVLTNESEENITPDYDSQTASDSGTYTVSIERGYFIEDTAVSRTLHTGENAEIAAYVPDGYKFDGWTSDVGEDIFEDASSAATKIYMVGHDVNITAHIVENPRLQIADKTNTSVTVKALSCDDINDGTVILAVYDDNGVLKNIYTKDFAQEVMFDNIDLTACTVKAMLWDSLNGMTPLADTAD